MNIRIEGVAEVVESLERKKRDMGQKLARGVAIGGERVASSARGDHDFVNRSGTLENSITSRPQGLKCEVGTNVEYAMYVEFGTRKMPAYPFLFPALQRERENVIAIIKEEVLR